MLVSEQSQRVEDFQCGASTEGTLLVSCSVMILSVSSMGLQVRARGSGLPGAVTHKPVLEEVGRVGRHPGSTGCPH